MKKQIKKTVSIVMALLMIFSMLSLFSNMTAMSHVEAATEQQAKNWMDKIVNDKKTINNGGTQCVAVFNEYLGAVFGINWRTNYGGVNYAYQIFDKNPPAGFTKISGAGNYKAGDIIVFKPNVTYGGYTITKGAGHVAIIYSVSGNDVYIVHQNFNGNTAPFKAKMGAGLKAAVKGVVRPTFDPGHTHTFPESNYYTDPAPTFTSTGLWKCKCTSCDYVASREIPKLGDANLRPGTYRIQSKLDSNKYVSVAPYECKLDGNICLYSKGIADQEFRITQNSDLTYNIEYNVYAIDVHGGGPVGNISLWESNGQNSVRWYIVPTGDGYCRVVSKAGYFNMDVCNGSTEDGTNIGAWYHNTGNVNTVNNAQSFKFILVSCFEHEWDAGVVTKQPTNTQAGTRLYTCVHCGNTKEETIPALFDNWPFKDVDKNSSLAPEILYAYEKGIISGFSAPDAYGQVKVKPDQDVTRAQFAIMVYKMAGSPALTAANFNNSNFSDVSSSTTGYAEIAWANSKGIISGFGNGKFKPNNNITRSQIAIMLRKFGDYLNCQSKYKTGGTNIISYSDFSEVKSNAVVDLQWAVDNGILSGVANKIKPNGNSTRGQCAAFCTRFYKAFIENENGGGNGNENPDPPVDETIKAGKYKFVNVGTGYNMNYAWGMTVDGVTGPIWQSPADGSPEQQFELVAVSDGKFYIKILHSDGGVLNVWRGSGAAQAGDVINRYTYSGSALQLFYITSVGNNEYVIRSASDQNKVVAPSGTAKHDLIKIANYNSSDAKQRWNLISVQ